MEDFVGKVYSFNTVKINGNYIRHALESCFLGLLQVPQSVKVVFILGMFHLMPTFSVLHIISCMLCYFRLLNVDCYSFFNVIYNAFIGTMYVC